MFRWLFQGLTSRIWEIISLTWRFDYEWDGQWVLSSGLGCPDRTARESLPNWCLAHRYTEKPASKTERPAPFNSSKFVWNKIMTSRKHWILLANTRSGTKLMRIMWTKLLSWISLDLGARIVFPVWSSCFEASGNDVADRFNSKVNWWKINTTS